MLKDDEMFRVMVLLALSEEPQKQEDIKKAIKSKFDVDVNCRTIRKVLKAFNDEFIEGKANYMVVSNRHGSYITRDESKIHKFNKARKKQALSLLYGVYNSEKRIGLNKNLSFDEFLMSK